MLDRNDDRKIEALVDEVLSALKTNLAEHQKIVTEARVGYLKKCKEVLRKKLSQLESVDDTGWNVEDVQLKFNLTPPQDHSRDFQTIIKMLELQKRAHEASPDGKEYQATIKLKAIDVQRFVLNDWSWMDQFLVSNSFYSETADRMLYERNNQG